MPVTVITILSNALSARLAQPLTSVNVRVALAGA